MRGGELVMVVALATAGCALTDQQIDAISSAVEQGTKQVVATGLNVVAPPVPGIDWTGTGIGGGIAGLLGYLLGKASKGVLRTLSNGVVALNNRKTAGGS